MKKYLLDMMSKGFKLANIIVSLLTTYLVPDLTGTSQ